MRVTTMLGLVFAMFLSCSIALAENAHKPYEGVYVMDIAHTLATLDEPVPLTNAPPELVSKVRMVFEERDYRIIICSTNIYQSERVSGTARVERVGIVLKAEGEFLLVDRFTGCGRTRSAYLLDTNGKLNIGDSRLYARTSDPLPTLDQLEAQVAGTPKKVVMKGVFAGRSVQKKKTD